METKEKRWKKEVNEIMTIKEIKKMLETKGRHSETGLMDRDQETMSQNKNPEKIS